MLSLNLDGAGDGLLFDLHELALFMIMANMPKAIPATKAWAKRSNQVTAASRSAR